MQSKIGLCPHDFPDCGFVDGGPGLRQPHSRECKAAKSRAYYELGLRRRANDPVLAKAFDANSRISSTKSRPRAKRTAKLGHRGVSKARRATTEQRWAALEGLEEQEELDLAPSVAAGVKVEKRRKPKAKAKKTKKRKPKKEKKEKKLMLSLKPRS